MGVPTATSKDEIVASVREDAVAEIDETTFAEVRATGGFADKLHAVLDSKVRGFLDRGARGAAGRERARDRDPGALLAGGRSLVAASPSSSSPATTGPYRRPVSPG
jgi:hypothetical protein